VGLLSGDETIDKLVFSFRNEKILELSLLSNTDDVLSRHDDDEDEDGLTERRLDFFLKDDDFTSS